MNGSGATQARDSVALGGADVATRPNGAGSALYPTFHRRYLMRAAAQLPGRQSRELDEIAARHFEAGLVRQPDQIVLTAYDVDGATTGIDLVTKDAPYLLDSVSAELRRTGHRVEFILHPQIVVRRAIDATNGGQLESVLDLDDFAEVPADALAESWMHFEIGLIPVDERQFVLADLHRVLVDVHNAVADAPKNYALIRGLADRIEADPGEFDRETSVEAAALLRWLADGNFMILGYAAYSANELTNPTRSTAALEQGVLRGEASITALELLPAYRSGAPLIIFKSPMVSTVRRSVRYDCVTVIAPPLHATADEANESGESLAVGAEADPSMPEDSEARIHVFLGLITDESDGTVGRVPVVRQRIAEVLRSSGARADSYTGRKLLAALRTMPRDELLQAPTADLLRLSQLVVDRADRHGIGVFARVHLNRDFVTVLVYFPGDRLGPETRARVRDVVLARWPGMVIGRDDRIVELDMARMQFLIALRAGEEVPNPDRATVEAEVARVTRRWSDDLADLLQVGLGELEAERVLRRYSGAFPAAYKEDFGAPTAVADLRRLEQLPDLDGLSFDVYTPHSDDEADRRLKIYRTGTPLSLGRTLPLLERMGIEVLDERPYEIERNDGTSAWVYDFGFRLRPGTEFGPDRSAAVIDTLRMVWSGGVESDGFNALVVTVGMSWRQAAVLRSYGKYLRQAGTNFSQGYIERTLSDHAVIAKLLVDLFEARFVPGRDNRDGVCAELVAGIEDALDLMNRVDEAAILRSLLALVRATVRTNYFQVDEDGVGPAAFAVKLDPHQIDDLPEPRPKFEIWVYSPRVEGVHLRFGSVARGGLRWSDRREDFREEALATAEAEMIRNTVIPASAAAAAFTCKNLPDPSVDRDAWLAEGIACYKIFITSMLELTDNYVRDSSGRQSVAKPDRTRCYDNDDPYLVVAADKGTATFSDIANSIAVDRGFWLGDAFASGGSVGYDHKAMGITAKGAWESVKYHFRELGIDTQSHDFTVVGIGDMSGDVFGNGMLLSEHIRLVAAFDHRHIFLDPTPDAAASFAERRRLFDLPRSSWADYNPDLISEGGGVYSRNVKAIPITPQVAQALRIPGGRQSLSPAELMHAILLAPVDLLWNGGIGTYVKASTESDLEAGDKTNDALRVNGNELRVKVVGEGGNLGLTQRGRIEFARKGGKINTDAIDNSAIVDLLDREVNIKILLDAAVRQGRIGHEERSELLEVTAKSAAGSALRISRNQNILLGVARHSSRLLAPVQRRQLAAMGLVDALGVDVRPTRGLPVGRYPDYARLCSPELAMLAAQVRLDLASVVEASPISIGGWTRSVLESYFPDALAARFPDLIAQHPARDAIVAAGIVNDLVANGGTTFAFRVQEETGADTLQIVYAYVVARELLGLTGVWSELRQEVAAGLPSEAEYIAYREIRKVLDRAVRWLIDARYPIRDVTAEIERYKTGFDALTAELPSMLEGRDAERLTSEAARLSARGLPPSLAAQISGLPLRARLLDAVEIANAVQEPLPAVTAVLYGLSESLGVEELLRAVTNLSREELWATLARANLTLDLQSTLAVIAQSVCLGTDPTAPTAERLRHWSSDHSDHVDKVKAATAKALSSTPITAALVWQALGELSLLIIP